MRERERKNRQAVIAAKKNRELAMKYLKETMTRYDEDPFFLHFGLIVLVKKLL